MLDMPSWMFTSFAAGKQSYPNNVGHAVLDVFYVFCRLRNLHAQDVVGHVGRFLHVLAQRSIFIPRTVLGMPCALL